MTDSYPNYLKMQCARCKIALDCPKNGSSPLPTKQGLKLCSIIGGYGSKPVDRSILSTGNQVKFDSGKQCISIIEVPLIEDDIISVKMLKVMHKPIKHPRELVEDITVMLHPKSYKD